MGKITYQTIAGRPYHVRVKLDGYTVGSIRIVKGGFRYFPRGQKTGGELLPSIGAVKRSLEEK